MDYRYPFLNASNLTSLIRAILFLGVLTLIFIPENSYSPWLPSIIYGAGVILDKLDGYLARKLNQDTKFGSKLDMWIDSFGFIVAPVLAVGSGKLPSYYLILSSAKFIYEGLKYQRKIRGKKIFALPENDLGKYIATFQMIFLTAVLTPIINAETVYNIAPVALAPSILVFIRDYLHVARYRN